MRTAATLAVLALLLPAGATAQRAATPNVERPDRDPPERREFPTWERSESSSSTDSFTWTDRSTSSPPSGWSPPAETQYVAPVYEQEFAAARCETYRRRSLELLEAQNRGENTSAQREALQEARAKVGC